jgi:hypothetical protein
MNLAADISPLENKSEVVFEVYRGPDGQGRHGFIMHWWDDGFHMGPQKRGQVFLANMQEHKERWEERGRPVRIIKERPREKPKRRRR